MGRLRPGAPLEAARAELAGISAQLERALSRSQRHADTDLPGALGY
jgi:hypothetical protein